MSLVQQLALLTAPWAELYNNSAVTQSAVMFGHFGGMMTAGGLALSADRATVRATRGPAEDLPRQLRELATTHPIIVTALAVTSLSGALMFAADVENLAASPAFWIKMALVAMLLGNGWLMLRTERALVRGNPEDRLGWSRLRHAAVASLVLWFSVVLAGSILPNVS